MLATCAIGRAATDRAILRRTFASRGHSMLKSNGGFAEFWPDYLRAHTKAGTRICHYIATSFGVALGLYGIATLQIGYVIAAIAGGYALAVGSHYAFKDGKPLVARSAVMGALADFRMIGLALTGRLGDEFRKYGIVDGDHDDGRRRES